MPSGCVDAEKIWHRHIAAFGPLTGLWEGRNEGIIGLGRRRGAPALPGYRTLRRGAHRRCLRGGVQDIQALLFLVLFLGLTVVVWRRFGAAYRPLHRRAAW